MPIEGKQIEALHAGDVAKSDVPTCHLDERIGEVRKRVRSAGWDTCVVVNGGGVVLGLLRTEALDADSEATAEQVMECGPRTYRLDADLEKAAKYMQKRDLDSVLVTTTDGQLAGLLRQEDVKKALAAVH